MLINKTTLENLSKIISETCRSNDYIMMKLIRTESRTCQTRSFPRKPLQTEITSCTTSPSLQKVHNTVCCTSLSLKYLLIALRKMGTWGELAFHWSDCNQNNIHLQQWPSTKCTTLWSIDLHEVHVYLCETNNAFNFWDGKSFKSRRCDSESCDRMNDDQSRNPLWIYLTSWLVCKT